MLKVIWAAWASNHGRTRQVSDTISETKYAATPGVAAFAVSDAAGPYYSLDSR